MDTGKKVYRIFGGGSKLFGKSWTPINPNTLKNARNELGLPNDNKGRFVAEGRIYDLDGVTIKPADPLDGNEGGETEYEISDSNKRVIVERISGANLEF